MLDIIFAIAVGVALIIMFALMIISFIATIIAFVDWYKSRK